MPKPAVNKLKFRGFISPRYTQVPDELFDELMSHLSGAELKVLLYIIRRTFGFKKDVDNISLSQICSGITKREGEVLDKGTGLSQQSVITALKNLVAIKAIVAVRRESKERGYEATTYSLNLIPFSNNLSTPSLKIREALPQKLEIQETVLQQTDLQNRNSSIKRSGTVSKDNNKDQNFQPIGNILKQRLGEKEEKNSTAQNVPEPIKVTINDISKEFGEQRNSRSNLTHAAHIYSASKKSPEQFISYLYEAKSITKQQGNVRKKMPYFFSVLEDVVGIQA